ncbi:asparaginase [Helicobacter sp. 13S00477-4]|uniref:asparaginase n=1 Tax=Helicobacter sp. 13S00477-4 TaxID=1905759 RepID=UPI000BA6C245|nr:asparaginase [Helicobacter sp. 13S00477-4]PAF52493.1 hypothetical protein BKH44_01550 [Helicobacter sp. 13S00477-4]
MKPKVAIGSLGGTIGMISESKSRGIAPKLDAKDFVGMLNGIDNVVQLYGESLFNLPSGHLKFEILLQSIQWAVKQVENGASGVILTQGTDTLEESAFFCELFWDKPEPLILMGAMRGHEEIGAEGMRNLYCSILCAISPNSRDRGVMIVMNDKIHMARWARKSHSLSVDAFCSGGKNYGFIAEGKVEYFYPAIKRMVLPKPSTCEKKIFLWEQTLSGDARVLEWIEDYQDGLVISGFGAGHVDIETNRLIGSIVQKIPVVICTGTTDGPTVYNTYGYEGAEIGLIKSGVIMGGYLSAKKARILLWAIVNNGLDIEIFKDYSKMLVC